MSGGGPRKSSSGRGTEAARKGFAPAFACEDEDASRLLALEVPAFLCPGPEGAVCLWNLTKVHGVLRALHFAVGDERLGKVRHTDTRTHVKRGGDRRRCDAWEGAKGKRAGGKKGVEGGGTFGRASRCVRRERKRERAKKKGSAMKGWGKERYSQQGKAPSQGRVLMTHWSQACFEVVARVEESPWWPFLRAGVVVVGGLSPAWHLLTCLESRSLIDGYHPVSEAWGREQQETHLLAN